jgi:hypothetical protein
LAKTRGKLAHGNIARRQEMLGRADVLSNCITDLKHIMNQNQNLPENLLYDVEWSFNRPMFDDRKSFDQAVAQRQKELGNPVAWRPNEIILTVPTIRIECLLAIVAPFELTSDNREHFTAGELLYKLHNALVKTLAKADHKYFEGLTMRTPGETPTYRLHLGS